MKDILGVLSCIALGYALMYLTAILGAYLYGI